MNTLFLARWLIDWLIGWFFSPYRHYFSQLRRHLTRYTSHNVSGHCILKLFFIYCFETMKSCIVNIDFVYVTELSINRFDQHIVQCKISNTYIHCSIVLVYLQFLVIIKIQFLFFYHLKWKVCCCSKRIYNYFIVFWRILISDFFSKFLFIERYSRCCSIQAKSPRVNFT